MAILVLRNHRAQIREMHNVINTRICVITSPRPRAAIVPMTNLLTILLRLCGRLYLITGNEGGVIGSEFEDIRCYSIRRDTNRFLLSTIVGNIVLQLKVAYRLVRLANKVDLCLFFMAEGLLFPVLMSKLIRKKTVLILAASNPNIARNMNTLSRIYTINELINYGLADRIVLYSSNLIKEWNLERYRSKISIAPRHFLDFDGFSIRRLLSARDYHVGYVGRLSQEKGISEFVKAIPKILVEAPQIEFMIAGDGDLRDEVETYLAKKELDNKVEMSGWISHDELPNYLNELKLLVLPSYTEGLPNIMLEAMACGTPVLATAVGAIPDVIQDGETGFIMENNSPECIASNVIRALKYPRLEQIAENASAFVEREFTYQAAVERYREILESLK